MPRRVKKEGDFTKASVRVCTKNIIKQIAEAEGLFEYELIDKVFRELYPSYYEKSENDKQ